MKYLLDTNTLSDFFLGKFQVHETLLLKQPDELSVSTLSLFEVEYGLQLNPKFEKKIRKPLIDFLQSIHLLPFEAEDAAQAAQIRAYLKEEGKPIGPYDVLLAGIALNRKMVFVTSNEKEFIRVKGLSIENWRR